MNALLALLAHLLTPIAKLLGPGGTSDVVSNSLLTKPQLLIINRTQRRSPNLSKLSRLLFGFWSLFFNQRRLR